MWVPTRRVRVFDWYASTFAHRCGTPSSVPHPCKPLGYIGTADPWICTSVCPFHAPFTISQRLTHACRQAWLTYSCRCPLRGVFFFPYLVFGVPVLPVGPRFGHRGRGLQLVHPRHLATVVPRTLVGSVHVGCTNNKVMRTASFGLGDCPTWCSPLPPRGRDPVPDSDPKTSPRVAPARDPRTGGPYGPSGIREGGRGGGRETGW